MRISIVGPDQHCLLKAAKPPRPGPSCSDITKLGRLRGGGDECDGSEGCNGSEERDGSEECNGGKECDGSEDDVGR